MRILLLTHRLPYTPNRGDRIRAYHLVRQLAATHDVHLVSLVHDAEEASHAAELRPLLASLTTVRVNRLARMVPAVVGLAGSRPLTHLLLHSRRVRPVLAGVIARAAPEVVVAYCTGMARYAFEPPLRGLPWVLDMVDVDSEKWAALADRPGWASRLYRREARLLRRFERAAIGDAAATTVVSDKERALLQRDPQARQVDVVPNGIDVDAFTPPDAAAASQDVVFCGVFDYAPNEAAALWLAAEIWPSVLRACPDARLLLVGMNPTRAVRALHGTHSIQVTGRVPDVRPYLWRSAVSVAPLLVARGVQNKVLEALAAGLPCVVTPAVLDGLPLQARAGCETAADAPAFVDAMVALLRTPPSARRGRARAADLAALSWDQQLRPMLRLVENAARPPSRR